MQSPSQHSPHTHTVPQAVAGLWALTGAQEVCVSVNNHLPKILCLVFGRYQAHSSPYSLVAVRHNSAAPVCHLFYSQSGQNVCKLFALAVSILTIQWTFLDFVLKVHLGSFILRARNNTIFWIYGLVHTDCKSSLLFSVTERQWKNYELSGWLELFHS